LQGKKTKEKQMARIKKMWTVIALHNDKKRSEIKGETLAEALVATEETLQPFLEKLIKKNKDIHEKE
tara:strand:+ start:225 stop:425 length:201 start_codon:yes stop_codon:yes gene_type:complete